MAYLHPFQGGHNPRRDRRYSGVGVLSEIVNLSAKPKASSGDANNRSKKKNASSFGLAAEIACFQPPKAKYQNQNENDETSSVSKDAADALAGHSKSERGKEPKQSLTRPAGGSFKAFKPTKIVSRNSKTGGTGISDISGGRGGRGGGGDGKKSKMKSVEKAKSWVEEDQTKLKQIQENRMLTPPTGAEGVAGEGTRTPEAVVQPPPSEEKIMEKVKLACDSTRKKRNRRKTVCFGDWVTGTPPPAFSNRRNLREKKSKEQQGKEDVVAETSEMQNAAIETPPSQKLHSDSCKKLAPSSAAVCVKTPSHAEILNMSKELNSMASNLLPETPGTTEKSGRLTLKERLAESWCGKSYYERLAEMTCNESAEPLDADEDDTIEDLQSLLQDALNKSKSSKKIKKNKKNRRRRSSMNKSKLLKKSSSTPEAVKSGAISEEAEGDLDTEEGEKNRRKSWADVVATTASTSTDESNLTPYEVSCDPGRKLEEGDGVVAAAYTAAAAAVAAEESSLIKSLKAELEEAKRRNVVLECQKEELMEDKTCLKSKLESLKQVAQQLTEQVFTLNTELDALSTTYA